VSGSIEDSEAVGTHRIKKGLHLPISGAPEQVLDRAPRVTRVALLGDDYPGLRPRLHVVEGDRVKRGQLLFEDRAVPGVRHTAPGAGTVIAINRGPRRVLQSVVIRLSDAEQAGEPAAAEMATFASYTGKGSDSFTGEEVRALLVESGLWTALRTRPFSKVPAPGGTARALFVNAMDSEPLAASPEVVVRQRRAAFQCGLRGLAKLCDGPTYLCVHADSDIPAGVDDTVVVERFAGPHPAGTAGLHIHLLAPASRKRTVWTVSYQDVIAAGELFRSGRLSVRRVVSLAGPPVRRPRLLAARVGACIEDCTRGELDEGEVRLISGSVLSGKKAMGPAFGFLSRYHVQISALAEGRRRRFLGWASPGRDRFSVLPVFLSRWLEPPSFDFTTSTHGARRAMVPIGVYERVMPMDIQPTFLLRSLVAGDVERAEKLGCLELDEEDLALCTFVCPSKNDYGPVLRRALERIEREG
jgi:Na+-transporting NADH:ubiquinone oxidoreductase subunit A